MRPQPYAADHDASVARAAARGAEPRSMWALIRWFQPRWEGETPIRIHARGVWRSRPDEDTPTKQVGGSILGAPQLSGDFRRLIENSAFETDADTGDYVRPCRAALARLGMSKPRTADRVGRLARGGWDPVAIARVECLDPEDAEVLIREGLRMWWRSYEERPLRR